LLQSELKQLHTKPRGLLLAAVARFVVVALFFDSLAPLFPQMAASYGLSSNYFQILLGVSYAAFAAFQLVSVPIINRIGIFRTITLSSIYLGVAAVLLCLSNHILIFAAVLLSMFIGNSVGSNATRVALRAATTDNGFKRLLARATGLVEVKQIAMPFIAGSIAAAFSWRASLLLLVTPVVIAGAWIQCAGKAETLRPLPQTVHLTGWLEILHSRRFLVPTLIAASFQIVFSPLSARLPFLLAHEAGLSSALVGSVLSAASATIAIGLFLSAHLIGRWSSRKIMMLGCTAMFAGLICMLMQHVYGVAWAVVGAILVQSALGFIVVPCSGDALNSFAENRTQASGLFGFIQPTVSGLCVALTGALNLSNTLAATALTVISLGLIAAVLLSSGEPH